MTPASKKSYFDRQSQAASKKKKVASKKAASKKNVKNKGVREHDEELREHDQELRNTTRNKKRLGTNSRTRNKEHDRGKGARQGTSSPA